MIETYQFLGKDKETYLEKYPFLNSFECRKWVRNLETRAKGKKGFTKQNFCNNLGRLLKYLEFTDMTPTELIDEAEKDSKLDRRERENPASYRIRQFFQYLENEGYSPKTCAAYSGTVRGFYSHNGFRIDVYIPKTSEIKDKIALNKDIIKRVLNNTQKLRDRVIILIMASSGMSIFDILDLKYKDVKGEESPREIIFRRFKNNNKYITYFSRECVNLLNQYIETERDGIKDKDYLFVNIRNEPLNYVAFYRILNTISNKTIGDNRINTKAFRRFFSTQMKLAGVNVEFVEYMMGHSIGVSEKYLDFEVLKESYEAAEDAVTIMTTVVKQKASEIKEEVESQFKSEVDMLRDELIELKTGVKEMLNAFGWKENVTDVKELPDWMKKVLNLNGPKVRRV